MILFFKGFSNIHLGEEGEKKERKMKALVLTLDRRNHNVIKHNVAGHAHHSDCRQGE